MNILITISADQLTGKESSFLYQPVKNFKPKYNGYDEAPFAIIPNNGDTLKVNEGDWLVEYHDGTKEVWTNEKMESLVSVSKEKVTAKPVAVVKEELVPTNAPKV